MYRAYKTEIDPNNTQITLLRQYTGTARFAWNWGIAKEQEFYDKGFGFHTAIDLNNIWCMIKYSEEDMRWIQDIPSVVPQNVFRDLERAYKEFFAKSKGHPRFKKKKLGYGSFRINAGVKIESNKIYVRKLGWVKLKEKNYIPQEKCCYITISERMDKWYVSVTFKKEVEIPVNNGPVVGIDLGIKKLATISDGTVIENPKVLSKYENKIKRLNREVSRKKKGSNNRKKAVVRLNRLWEKVSNIRTNNIHKLTTLLTKTKSVIVVEDLDIKRMISKQHNINKALIGARLGEIKRQLEYKSKWYGSELKIAPKYYPSSQICSKCGNIQKLKLSERTYNCPKCHSSIDRDLNAAVNLERLALSSKESVNAYKRWEVTGTSNIKIIPVPVDEIGIEHEVSKETSISFKEQSESSWNKKWRW